MGDDSKVGTSVLPFFEGTEKKAELLIDRELPSLRARGDDHWYRVAGKAGAKVLSKISNDRCDAYLLSESSLFVYDHKIIMITCGQTELPEAVLDVAGAVGPEGVRFFTYERKNEVLPNVQPTSFFDDVRKLNERLPGRAFQFGDEDDHHLYLFHLDRSFAGDPRDMTVEVLMYGIDERIGRLFRQGGDGHRRAVRDETGVAGILPGFTIDDHLFEPHGYSLNGIRDDRYWTLHVTPEPVSSYASFETNQRLHGDLDRVARRLLDLFRPRSFDLVLFDRGQTSPIAVEGFRIKEHVARDLTCGYRVRFLSFFRPRPGVRQPTELTVG